MSRPRIIVTAVPVQLYAVVPVRCDVPSADHSDCGTGTAVRCGTGTLRYRYLEAATVHASCLHDASVHDSSAIIERGPTVHASCLHASMHDSSAIIEHR